MRRPELAWLLTGLLGGCSSGHGCTGEEEPGAPSAARPPAPPASEATSDAIAPTPPPTASAVSEPAPPPPDDLWGDRIRWPGTLAEQNELMFRQLEHHHALGADAMGLIRRIIAEGKWTGQGNPEASEHALSPNACRARLAERGLRFEDPAFERICGARYMAPLYDPDKGEKAEEARACIDRFEFPNIPCVYPVTWVQANHAVDLCHAMGKRLCDAHEWEGACYGRLEPPDYDFALARGVDAEAARGAMRKAHNARVEPTKRWAYGPEYRKGVCATGSKKSDACKVIGWKQCGSNTYPAGSFPDCVSPLGVYDIHGNAAEHMNIPLAEDQLASHASRKYGHTEMKGSWFVFDLIRAHEDHCRWRAPDWHASRVTSPRSHHNYHLGFRCCKSRE
jgi:hypothetical protein